MILSDRVVAMLNQAGVAHALIGAAALAAAGVARSTLDLDLLTIDRRVLDPVFWNDLRAAGAQVDVRRGDADDPLAGVIRATLADDRPVDVIVGRHLWQQRAVERARTLPNGLRVRSREMSSFSSSTPAALKTSGTFVSSSTPAIPRS